MRILKLPLLSLVLLLLNNCDKVRDYYNPGVECASNWLTNGYYHLPVEQAPAIKNSPESMTATVNGAVWKPSTSPEGYHYKNITRVSGTFNNIYIGITYNASNPSECKVEADKGYTNYSRIILDSHISNVTIDTVNKLISLDFSGINVLHTYNPEKYDTVRIESGKVRGMKYPDVFERPSYTLKDADSSLYQGWWQMIEITDCSAGKVYYPTPDKKFYFQFDPAKFNSPNNYMYEYPVYAEGVNSFTCSYKFLNDSVLVIKNQGGTQVAWTQEAMDFDSFVVSKLNQDTLTVRHYKNLLELKTTDNVFLRFFK